jgi:hypothetical protein
MARRAWLFFAQLRLLVAIIEAIVASVAFQRGHYASQVVALELIGCALGVRAISRLVATVAARLEQKLKSKLNKQVNKEKNFLPVVIVIA